MNKAIVIHELQAVRRKVAAAFRGSEWTVEEAETGREGVLLAVDKAADVVLCALDSPTVRGGDVVRALRRTHGRALVIALGEHGAEESRTAMDLGADDYLPVSASAELILRAARARIERRRFFYQDSSAPENLDTGVVMGILFRDKHLGLTHRESEVLAWIVQGKSNQDLSTILSISPRTVEKHVEGIYNKLGVETRAAAMLTVIERTGLFAASRKPQP